MRPEGGRDGALNWQNSSFESVSESTFHVRTSNSTKLKINNLELVYTTRPPVQMPRARVQVQQQPHITHSAFSKSPPHLMSLPPLSVSFAQHAPKIFLHGLSCVSRRFLSVKVS